jgi:hypothetical protein
MKKKKLLIAGFAIAVVIMGYKVAISGEVKNSSSQKLPTIAEGIELPPNPGKLADSTKIGIDINNNGVRDEVEIYLANKYGYDKELYQKILEFVKKKQSVLNISLDDEKAAKSFNIWADSEICLSKKLGIPLNDAIPINNDLNAQIFNSFDRQTHLQDIMLKSEQLQIDQEKANCE